MTPLIGKDKKALAGDITTSSDDFTEYPALTDLNDTVTDLFPNGISRRIYVGAAGDLMVLTRHGEQKKFQSVPAGTVLEIAVAKIMKTGTAATKIVVMY